MTYEYFGRLRGTPKKPRRGAFRDYKYRAWIRTLPCACCGRGPTQAAHTGSDGGMRMKSSDTSCIPLCEAHHLTGSDSYHVLGKKEFEARHGINCAALSGRMYDLWLRGKRQPA